MMEGFWKMVVVKKVHPKELVNDKTSIVIAAFRYT